MIRCDLILLTRSVSYTYFFFGKMGEGGEGKGDSETQPQLIRTRKFL